MLGCVVTLLALCAFCVFLVGRCRVAGGAAPLVTVGACILWLTVWGVLGVLQVGVWLLYAACFGLAGFALASAKGREAAKKLVSPGFLLFLAGALVLLVYLAVRQPPFSEWDEFVTWGPTVKLLKLNGSLYTTADVGWWWTTTQSPALPLFSYFVQFFGVFAAWKVFWAYDVLMLVAFAALLAPFGKKQWRVAVPLGTLAVLVPYIFNVFFRQVYLNKMYMNAYGDVPAGVMLGGVLALYFSQRDGENKTGLWQALVALGAFALVKENLLPLALVAAGAMAADSLFFVPAKKHKIAVKAGRFIAPFAAVLAPYALWSAHANWANAQNPGTGGESTSMPLGQAALETVRQLFAKNKEPRFVDAAEQLGNAFFAVKDPVRVSMFGGGLATFAVIFAVFALALVLQKQKRQRRRTALVYTILLVGFVCYQFVLLVSYTYILYPENAVNLIDYDRYIGPYYIAWFMLGVLLLAQAALGRGKRAWAAKTAVLATACAGMMLFAAMVPPGLSMPDYTDNQFAEAYAVEESAQRVAEALPEGARVFFVCQGGNGREWFEYHFYLLPKVLDYSFGGGVSLVPPGQEGGEQVSAAQLEKYLVENGCDYILVLRLDEVFVQAYGGLFAGKLDAEAEGPLLYERQAGGLYTVMAVNNGSVNSE